MWKLVDWPAGEDQVTMLDSYQVERLREHLSDRFTPEELIELLGVTTEQVFDRFLEECLELNLEDL